MTQRERIMAVYRGETPDVVPYMLDLSHWFYHKNKQPWDLSQSFDEPERELIAYHQQVGAGFYMPNLGSFYAGDYAADVRAGVEKVDLDGRPEIVWRYETPSGRIERRRAWDDTTYSWHITKWGISDEADLCVLGEALAARSFRPTWDRYESWRECVGSGGVVYLGAGYSAMGQLLNYWMGIERTMYAVADWPGAMHEVVDRINENNLKMIDLLAASPAEVIIMGDNFSSDVQPPRFFDEWARPYYVEALRRLHTAGKWVAVHIDGRLRGALRMFAEIGADCADAVTPLPMGDLSPAECRQDAGADMILSGGVSPDLWLPNASTETFTDAVRAWLELKRTGPRLIANAGDQVPPGAVEDRIELMRDLVDEHGRY